MSDKIVHFNKKYIDLKIQFYMFSLTLFDKT